VTIHGKEESKLMKNLLAIALIAFTAFIALPSFSAVTQSDTVGLEWDAVTEPGKDEFGNPATLSGYKIYFGKNPSAFSHVKEVLLVTQTTIDIPEGGKWYFVCVSVNSDGVESLPSDVVEYSTIGEPGTRPGTPTLRIVSATTTKASTVTTVENITLVP
jgi:hypothetical protein